MLSLGFLGFTPKYHEAKNTFLIDTILLLQIKWDQECLKENGMESVPKKMRLDVPQNVEGCASIIELPMTCRIDLTFMLMGVSCILKTL